MKTSKKVLACASAVALVAAVIVLPRALEAGKILVNPDDTVAIADYQLRSLTTAEFVAKVDEALSQDDPQLAASIAELADGYGKPLPAETLDKIATASAFDLGGTVQDTVNGALWCDVSSEAGMAGCFAADVVGIGDIRDLATHGPAFFTGDDYDPVILTLSIAGVALTGMTIISVGTSVLATGPVKHGLAVLKSLKRTAKSVPPWLSSELGSIALDRSALELALSKARNLDLSAAAREAARVIPKEGLETIVTVADDLGTVAGKGYRALNQTVEVSTSTRDVSKLRKLADATGTKYRAALTLLGKGALTIAPILFGLLVWTATGFIWLVIVAFIALQIGAKILRMITRQRRPRPANG